MENYLGPVLTPLEGAARVYVVVDCGPGECPQFPRLRLQSPSKGQTGLAAVREIFAKDKQTSVSSGPNGLIRIRFGKPPSALLQTKIHSFRFTPHEQYNIISAEGALEGAKEVKAAIQKLGLEIPVVVVSELVQEPMEGVPHLPPEIKDVTLDQALDLFAKTFGEVMLYEECIRPDGTRCFLINHAYVQDGKWLDALRARWDTLVLQGYKTGVCPVHRIPLKESVVYMWSHSSSNVLADPRPQYPLDSYFRREEHYPMHLPYGYRRSPSPNFDERKVQRFCPVCQQLFETDTKQ